VSEANDQKNENSSISRMCPLLLKELWGSVRKDKDKINQSNESDFKSNTHALLLKELWGIRPQSI
jgi:hypothetical protein